MKHAKWLVGLVVVGLGACGSSADPSAGDAAPATRGRPTLPDDGGAGSGGAGGTTFPPPSGDGPAWFIQPCLVQFSAPSVGFFDTPPTAIPVGTTVSLPLAVANTSKKTPLNITAISVEGTTPSDFSVDAASVARAMSAPLPPNESSNGRGDVAVTVSFTAMAEGPRSALLRIVSDAGTALVPL